MINFLESVMDVEKGKLHEELADKPRTTIFNEMWFLTVDPLIRASVRIAKLSERYYCWRVFEDFHSQELSPIL